MLPLSEKHCLCPLVTPLAILTFLSVALFCVVHWIDTSKFIASIVAGALLFQAVSSHAEEPPKPAAPIAATVVVVVVGTITYIYLKRFCQRHFPRPPAGTTNAQFSALSGDNWAASATFYTPYSCELTDASIADPPSVTMELDGVLTESGMQLNARKMDGDVFVDGAEFSRLIGLHGIAIGQTAGQQFFGRNGKPATQEEVPIYFWTEDGEQYVSATRGPSLPSAVAIERSKDMVHWETLSRVMLCAGQRLKFRDLTVANQMFYRFRIP